VIIRFVDIGGIVAHHCSVHNIQDAKKFNMICKLYKNEAGIGRQGQRLLTAN